MQVDVDVSVVIPVLNGATTLPKQLVALSSQVTSARFEILVADNGSVDGTRALEAIRKDGRIQVVDASRMRGINVARNEGVRRSRGDLVIFCDADDVVHPGWIEAYWQTFLRGGQLMGGALKRVKVSGGPGEWQRQLNEGLRLRPWPTGANCAAPRDVFDECGMFDESWRGGGDETEFFWRAQLLGYKLSFVDEAGIDYIQRRDHRGAFRQSKQFGRSHVLLYAEFRAHGMVRPRLLSTVRNLMATWARVARSPRDFDARRSAVRFSGVIFGRVAQSIRSRTIFV